MSAEGQEDQNIFSLLDLHDFLMSRWKLVATSILASGVLGGALPLFTPNGVTASALIQSARVLGTDVETTMVLVEKMRIPTYYSTQTHALCGTGAEHDRGAALIKKLRPSVAKQSSFVRVAYASLDAGTSGACVDAVLENVKQNQHQIAQRQIDLATSTLAKEREKLSSAEAFVAASPIGKMQFDFKDAQFSAATLLAATLQSRQAEITELKSTIKRTELLLTEPQTQSATFAAPIYSSSETPFQRHSRSAMVGIFVGGALALVLLLFSRARKTLSKQLHIRSMQPLTNPNL